jgi:hypothetical protein
VTVGDAEAGWFQVGQLLVAANYTVCRVWRRARLAWSRLFARHSGCITPRAAVRLGRCWAERGSTGPKQAALDLPEIRQAPALTSQNTTRHHQANRPRTALLMRMARALVLGGGTSRGRANQV